MSYESALVAAGADILEQEVVGCYSGVIWFLCRVGSELIILRTYYGSCSGCDYFENTFEDYYDEPPIERLKAFGKDMLKEDCLSFEDALSEAAQDTYDRLDDGRYQHELVASWAVKYPELRHDY